MKAIKQYFTNWLLQLAAFARYRDTTIALLIVCLLTLFLRFHRVALWFLPKGKGLYFLPSTYIISGLIFLLVPLIFAWLIKPSDKFGFQIGKVKTWLADIGIAYGILVILIFIVGGNDDFLRTYPLFKPRPYSWSMFILWEVCQLTYMFGWEFIFRGYLLFTAKKEVGVVPAIFIQMLPFAFLHLGKPELEVYGSIFAGLFLGMIAIRAKSFLPCVILHFSVALTMDVYAIIQKNML